MIKLLLLSCPLLAQQGAVEGIVFNKLTKAPIEGVLVRMTMNSDPAQYHQSVSGADGAYRIENLPSGVYGPWVNVPDGFSGPNPHEFMRQQIRVAGEVAKFDVELTPKSVIRGRVFDPDRRPAVAVSVSASPLASMLGGGVATDAEGRFSLLVAPGDYRLGVRSSSDKFATTYYPNVTDPSLAERIVVGEAADLGGYEIRLQPALGNRLRGVVRDDQGKPVADVDLGIPVLNKWVKSNTEGAFDFKPVPAGEWRITAMVKRDGIPWTGAAEVVMPKADFDKTEVRIAPPFPVDIVVEGAPAKRSVRIELRPVSGPAYDAPYQEKDGRVRFDRIYPGAYRVGVWGFAAGHYVKSIFLGPEDVTGRAIELSPASPPLRVVYAPDPGRVTGEVDGGAGAKVVLISADRETYLLGADAVTVTCDDKGRFTVSDLRPGGWLALAVAKTADTTAVRDRVFGAGLWRQATSFRVAERETATVQLKIITDF